MGLSEYQKEFFDGLQHGLPRLKGIKNAIDHALEQQDTEGVLELYYEYLEEDVIHGNSYKAILMFPEYVGFFEKHPEVHEDYNHDVMWSYKWILGSIEEFYQIPMSQIENIYNQYVEFCKRFNYSLRSYYNILWMFIDSFLGSDQQFCGLTAKEAHKKMLLSKRDNLCDCRACETADEVYYHIHIEKDMEKGLEIAKPLLEGRLHCTSQPHGMLANIAEAYLEAGDLENADKYISKAARLINRDFGNEASLFTKKSLCILILSYVKPQDAMRIFRKTLPFVQENESGNELFEFYRAAYHFMANLEANNVDMIKLKLPFKNDPIYHEDNLYKPGELKDYFYEKAKEYADKFDKRNGNSLFNQRLEQKYEPNYDKYVPYEEAPDCPYLDYIRENMEDGKLPSDFSLPNPDKDDEGNRYDDGAMDGILFYHSHAEKNELGELEQILDLAAKGSDTAAAAKTEKYLEKTGYKALTLIDNLQNYILSHTDKLPANAIYSFAIELTVASRNKEAVKLGLSILEIFSDYNDALLEAIMDLARCDEFSLFCIWAVKNLENGNDLIFQIAKDTFGWGRIFAINQLEPTTDEIKSWLLQEGIKNNIYSGYSAIAVFQKADIHKLLEDGLPQEQLTPVGADIAYLILDGPTIGIKAFEDGENIVNMYLDSAEKLEIEEIDRSILQIIGANYDNEAVRTRIREMGIEFEIAEKETEEE
ncbi:MAG: hypothetical protein IJ192_00310 [Clostridia bacterium]|nr:hypothetical protein [Clostridia bacterium]MBR2176378.1 hypothetical protein [Clostridia bacterium]